MRISPLSMRAQLGLALAVLASVAAVILGLVSYSMSRQAVRTYVEHSLQQSAANRRHALADRLALDEAHGRNLLQDISLGCGASGMLNRICARETMLAFLR